MVPVHAPHFLRRRSTRTREREQPHRFRYAPSIVGGRALTAADIERLAAEGFRSILDVREEGEEGQLLSPNVEATWAHTYAMEHGRASLSAEHPQPEVVDEFLAEISGLPRPLYVHSERGRRAAALLTIHLALERRVSGEEALATAKSMGMECASEALERFVVAEVERRRTRSGAGAR